MAQARPRPPSPGIGELDDVTCPICCDKFVEPKVLPCGHSYCKKCIQAVAAESVGTPKCPICKKEFGETSSLPTNYSLQNLTLRFQAQQVATDGQEGQDDGATTMQVFVRDFAGKTMTFHVKRDAHVDTLMDKVGARSGIEKQDQRLLYQGRQMEEGKQLSEYHVVNNATAHLVVRLRGGQWHDTDTKL